MSTTQADTAEELRLEQIRKDIARRTQEMLYEPRKYRVAFAAVMVSAVVGSLAAGGIIGGALVAYLHQTVPQSIVIQLAAPPAGKP
jgi:hypothetical protein